MTSRFALVHQLAQAKRREMAANLIAQQQAAAEYYNLLVSLRAKPERIQ